MGLSPCITDEEEIIAVILNLSFTPLGRKINKIYEQKKVFFYVFPCLGFQIHQSLSVLKRFYFILIFKNRLPN